MNTEATLISAVCKNKDISTLLADNVDDLFVSHKDIWDSLKKDRDFYACNQSGNQICDQDIWHSQ